MYMHHNCLQNETFRFPEDVAKALAEEFGRKVYGNKKLVIQTYEERSLPRLSNKCEVLSIKFRRKLGLDL